MEEGRSLVVDELIVVFVWLEVDNAVDGCFVVLESSIVDNSVVVASGANETVVVLGKIEVVVVRGLVVEEGIRLGVVVVVMIGVVDVVLSEVVVTVVVFGAFVVVVVIGLVVGTVVVVILAVVDVCGTVAREFFVDSTLLTVEETCVSWGLLIGCFQGGATVGRSEGYHFSAMKSDGGM